MAFAEAQGIGIRAFSGSGNEAMITIEDYMEGFEVDELTRTVMLYVESFKQGRRFFESARRLSCKKPIVLLKGGQTQAGNRAASSHTGAMASDNRLFDAACQQAGVVKVDQPMELLDLSAAFSSLPLPGGNRIAIMTLGGGWGVVTADLCEQFGLEVPELPPELIDNVSWLREQTELPICIGFGISQPEHVRVLRDVADGIIVGSAIVRYSSGRSTEIAASSPIETSILA